MSRLERKRNTIYQNYLLDSEEIKLNSTLQRPCPAGFVLGLNQIKEFKIYTGAYHILLIANKSRIKCSKGAL